MHHVFASRRPTNGGLAWLISSKYARKSRAIVGAFPTSMSRRAGSNFTTSVNTHPRPKVARLLRERIKAGIEAEALEKMGEVTTDLAVRLAEPVGMVRNLMANKASEAIALVGAEESDWPPCMQKGHRRPLWGRQRQSFWALVLRVNVGHVGAATETSCVNFFRGAPDFSEATTSYQVQHVYQHEYTPAGCGKLKVNHNCPVLPGDNRTCDQSWMDHPLKYIRATQRWKRLTERSCRSRWQARQTPNPTPDANVEGVFSKSNDAGGCHGARMGPMPMPTNALSPTDSFDVSTAF